MAMSFTEILADRYGGTWQYDGRASWWCSDGTRHVSRVSVCGCDDDCGHAPAYYLYAKGATPVRIRPHELAKEWARSGIRCLGIKNGKAVHCEDGNSQDS